MSDKGDEVLFVDAINAINNTEQVGYLGDRAVVDSILRIAAAEAMKVLGDRDVGMKGMKIFKIGLDHLKPFLGDDSAYAGVRGWNKPGAIDTFVSKWTGVDATTPIERLAGAFTAMVNELMDVVAYAQTADKQESWDW